MSARSQLSTEVPIEGLNLALSLRNCLASGVFVVDCREQIISATSEITWLVPAVAGKSVSAPLSRLPGPLQDLVRAAIARKTTVTREHLTLTSADKHTRDFQVTAHPMQREAGAVEVVVILHDLTPIGQLEQKLARFESLAMLGTLSAGMAHEIKNALVAVRTFIELLLEKNPTEDLAGVVRREMRRLDTIMSQMQRFSGKEGCAHGPVRVHDVLEHSLRLVEHQLAGKFISLNRSFNAAPDAVRGNDHQLEQVFVNLLLNAVEASGPNGSLTVATQLLPPASPRPDQSHLCITVADTGMGIAPEHLDRMFEPFFTTKPGGTGLGLPITRRIVQEHQGQITVQSEPNKGTIFSILLPASDSAR